MTEQDPIVIDDDSDVLSVADDDDDVIFISDNRQQERSLDSANQIHDLSTSESAESSDSELPSLASMWTPHKIKVKSEEKREIRLATPPPPPPSPPPSCTLINVSCKKESPFHLLSADEFNCYVYPPHFCMYKGRTAKASELAAPVSIRERVSDVISALSGEEGKHSEKLSVLSRFLSFDFCPTSSMISEVMHHMLEAKDSRDALAAYLLFKKCHALHCSSQLLSKADERAMLLTALRRKRRPLAHVFTCILSMLEEEKSHQYDSRMQTEEIAASLLKAFQNGSLDAYIFSGLLSIQCLRNTFFSKTVTTLSIKMYSDLMYPERLNFIRQVEHHPTRSLMLDTILAENFRQTDLPGDRTPALAAMAVSFDKLFRLHFHRLLTQHNEHENEEIVALLAYLFQSLVMSQHKKLPSFETVIQNCERLKSVQSMKAVKMIQMIECLAEAYCK
eukprot:m.225184 g.225184  ORF g.225184 m.225184 type:complete len:448 (+) comp40010_c0_seq3:30-1373(+)